MPGKIRSIKSKEFQDVIENARKTIKKQVNVHGQPVTISFPFPSPADWRDKWIYFLMIDRFNKAGDTNNYNYSPDGANWTDRRFDNFLGGNIKGITEKLDYLKDLGVESLWITPPFKNCAYENSYYGYGIQDFLSIDPRFGTEADMIELVEQAHARDIFIIFDIVLNHAGSVFNYDIGRGQTRSVLPWRDSVSPILWKDAQGNAQYADVNAIPKPIPPDVCIWPEELQKDEFFRRKGEGDERGGDFGSLREFVSAERQVRETLIKAYQFIIAKYDIDGFRIDTLKYIEADFARIFGNAMREFALSIGKKNFFTFGEILDSEEKISEFIGRNTSNKDGLVGVDAALDFPLFFKLPSVIKGWSAPKSIYDTYEHRKNVQEKTISSHGEASQYFVTFLDNHDGSNPKERIYCGNPDYINQVFLAVGALFTLQGIPCLYYGTESGLYGNDQTDRVLRQALWMVEDCFNPKSHFYVGIRKIAQLRKNEPAVRYGRQYFREVSGNGIDFELSDINGGILSYSRILNDIEILIVMNTNTTDNWNGYVCIDPDLNPVGKQMKILYSNFKTADTTICEDTNNWRALNVSLKPMEIQIWK